MTNKWKGRRTLSLLLAFAMLLTMLPPMSLPAYSTGNTEDYSQYIGYTATINPSEDIAYIEVLDVEPTDDWGSLEVLSFYTEDFSEDVVFTIDGYKVVSEETLRSLWYQVSVTSGTAEGFENGYWILQNYLGEDAYEEDTLILTKPEVEDEQPHTTNPGVYGALIGATGAWNMQHTAFQVTADPTQGVQKVLNGTEVYIDSLLIENVHWDAATMQLWLKVAAPEGQTLPTQLQQYPWVYQNTTSVYTTENWQQTSPDVLNLTLPNNGKVDMATGVAVSGLPEGASLEVQLPTVGGEALPGVYDIKIYDANGNPWQPIDEGKTVNITMPTQYEVVKVTHIIDYAGAILGREDLVFVPVADIDAATLALLGPAMDAFEAVYGNRDYVATEELGPFTAENGMFSFAANSFSIYIYFDTKNQDADNDWESYQGYKTVQAAKDALDANNAYIYQMALDGSLELAYNKTTGFLGLQLAPVDEYYKLTTYLGGDATTYISISISGILKNSKIKFTPKKVTGEDYVFISYIGTDNIASQQTIIIQIVNEVTNTEGLNGIPLYIGIDPNTTSDFPTEPTADMSSGYYWYTNGKLDMDKGVPVKYADNSNALFACNSFENSALMKTVGNVSFIIDH